MIALAVVLLCADFGARGRTFDPARAAALSEFSWPGLPVASLSFSPDGRKIAVSVADDSIRILSVTAGKEVATVRTAGVRFGQVAFSGDGRRFLGYDANGHALRIYDSVEGRELAAVPDVIDSLFAFAPASDGRGLAVSSRGACRLFELDPLREARALPARDGIPVTAVFVSRDGRRIAWVQKDALVCDSADGRGLLSLPSEGIAVAVAFSPANRRIATVDTLGLLKLWDGEKGDLLKSARACEGQVHSLAWSADGRWLATGGNDGTLRVWNPQGLVEVRRLEAHRGIVYALAFSPDGRTLASGGRDGRLRVWGAR